MEYSIKRSARRTIALQILPDGKWLVRCPYGMTGPEIEAFITSKEKWINRHTQKAALSAKAPKFSEAQLKALTKQAKQVIPSRVAYYAEKMGVGYSRIAIRHQHTRWGSCTSRGNLNFNCLLLCAPPEVLDYVVVHELCHRKHLNHSKEFWAAVAEVLPDYASSKKWLKEQGSILVAGLMP